MPIISEEARKTRIEEALRALPRDSERIPVPWQDTTKTFPVIRISLDSVLLNPRSHRIRAQLESHPQRQLVLESPFSEESQDVITAVLRETEGFERLKVNLAEEDQREAGVVTRAGLLVNGNTRAAALRDIDKKYIRVAVLPGDATQEEIDELELRLQMKRDLKQEYTFTNELLFVEEREEPPFLLGAPGCVGNGAEPRQRERRDARLDARRDRPDAIPAEDRARLCRRQPRNLVGRVDVDREFPQGARLARRRRLPARRAELRGDPGLERRQRLSARHRRDRRADRWRRPVALPRGRGRCGRYGSNVSARPTC